MLPHAVSGSFRDSKNSTTQVMHTNHNLSKLAAAQTIRSAPYFAHPLNSHQSNQHSTQTSLAAHREIGFRQWQKQYKSLFPYYIFYLDGIDGATKARLTRDLQRLGAVIAFTRRLFSC